MARTTGQQPLAQGEATIHAISLTSPSTHLMKRLGSSLLSPCTPKFTWGEGCRSKVRREVKTRANLPRNKAVVGCPTRLSSPVQSAGLHVLLLLLAQPRSNKRCPAALRRVFWDLETGRFHACRLTETTSRFKRSLPPAAPCAGAGGG